MIRRSAYSFRRITGKTVHVKSHMIQNRGLSGKGPYVLPKLKPGKLQGYKVASPTYARHKSLMIASGHDSPLTVFRRLQVLARYLKRTSPHAKRTVLKNAAWMRKKF